MLGGLFREEIERLIRFLLLRSIVQPASQWCHAVPTYMAWARQNNPAHFIRFQGGQMPVPGPILVPGIPPAPAELYVHPGDPCSSRAVPTTQGKSSVTESKKLGT